MVVANWEGTSPVTDILLTGELVQGPVLVLAAQVPNVYTLVACVAGWIASGALAHIVDTQFMQLLHHMVSDVNVPRASYNII